MNRSYSQKSNINSELLKWVLLTGIMCIFSVYAVAQKQKGEQKYYERAAEVAEEVSSSSHKAFNVVAVPEKYKNESAIIIARSYWHSSSSKLKFKMTTLLGGAVMRSNYQSTYHERVLIQDKSALEQFSSLNYRKVLDKTQRRGLYSLKNTSLTYIGATVIKPNGAITKVNSKEEEVLTENTDKAKDGKMAIPDLQVGDILDYYIRVEEVMENQSRETDTDIFYTGGEYPILYYELKYMLGKKWGADLFSGNGAKQFSIDKNEDGEHIIELADTNLPKRNTVMWSSALRQQPYHIIRMTGTGKVDVGPYLSDAISALRYYYQAQGINYNVKNEMEDYFGGKKEMKAAPDDSLVNYLYNYYRWWDYGTFQNMNVGTERNYKKMNAHDLALSFGSVLRKLGIDNDLVVTSGKYFGPLRDIIAAGDLEPVVVVKSRGQLRYFSFNDFLIIRANCLICMKTNHTPQWVYGAAVNTQPAAITTKNFR